MQKRITDDIHALMAVIPPGIGQALTGANRIDELLEVILDLGRVPTARYIDSEVVLSQSEVTHADIDYVVTRIGDFDADNRAGLERTLHRISGLRNRRGQVVGLTCRVAAGPVFPLHLESRLCSIPANKRHRPNTSHSTMAASIW